jgi:hypothetical protein
MLRVARFLEKSDKREGAFVLYRRIVREYPGTTEARASAGRIQALGNPP